MWFAQVLIQGYDDATVVKTKSKYFTVQWDWPDRLTCFAFEGGDHHLRWAAIADEAVRLAGSTTKKVTTIVFRTPTSNQYPVLLGKRRGDGSKMHAEGDFGS